MFTFHPALGLELLAICLVFKLNFLAMSCAKADKWFATSKEQKFNAEKEISTPGIAKEENDLRVKFVSQKEGSVTFISLSITGFDNQFKKADVFLDYDQYVKLISFLDKAEETVTALKAEKAKAAELLK